MNATGESARTRPVKGASAFRTIGEVALDLDVPAHVLRFWEAKFPQLKPLKRGGGRRYYRPEDVALLRRIRQCLYQDGYTIRGVQLLLTGAGDERAARAERDEAPSLFPLETGQARARPAPARRARSRSGSRALSPDTLAALDEIRRELLDARSLVEELLRLCRAP